MNATAAGLGSDGPAGPELPPTASGFAVQLDNFEGPFDLLLQLISKHRLDITEVSLSRVTDDFIEHIKKLGGAWDLDQTTGFLVIAATLLDLKIVRLLPSAQVEDEEDLALLEARDLLFARLLQYRAFKQVGGIIDARLAAESRRVPRTVSLEERFSALLPEVLIAIGPEEFAALAARVLAPKEEPQLGLAHLHAPTVSVREQAAVIVDRLRRQRTATFRSLTSDSPDTITTVARFLALLELFREGVVAFDQAAALGELSVRWTGSDDGEIQVRDEYDDTRATDERPAASVTDTDIALLAQPAGGDVPPDTHPEGAM
ncbi:MAG: segregation/condensation protein A [Nocardioidaceae bacterium]|nr:segregation/condensation protein A [Nocardioidaceae bacterium]